jgi:hypothetical protein
MFRLHAPRLVSSFSVGFPIVAVRFPGDSSVFHIIVWNGVKPTMGSTLNYTIEVMQKSACLPVAPSCLTGTLSWTSAHIATILAGGPNRTCRVLIPHCMLFRARDTVWLVYTIASLQLQYILTACAPGS